MAVPSPEPPKKIRYQSRSVEQAVERPRAEVWADVVAMVRMVLEPAAELSVEPPWRFAVEMDTGGSALDFWQSTIVIRDDGPTCHVAWGMVFDPEPTDAGWVEADTITTRMRDGLRSLTV